MTPTLAQLIQQFTEIHPEWADQKMAFAQCDIATDKFITFAQDRGYKGPLARYTFACEHPIRGTEWRDTTGKNPEPQTYDVYDAFGRSRRNESDWVMCSWHCVVDAGHILIDFTARQYHDYYAFPHIIAIGEQMSMAAKAGA